MELERYNFTCKKIFHESLRLSKSLGHSVSEIEHLAICLLNEDNFFVERETKQKLSMVLLHDLKLWPKVFGASKISFGPRLIALTTKIERSINQEIDEKILWQNMLLESTMLKNGMARVNEQMSINNEFVSWGEKFDGEVQKGSRLKSKVIKDRQETQTLNKELDQNLRKFTIDLTEAAAKGNIDPVIGRDHEARRIFEILGRKKKNNPLLLGDPGVGKSAIAELVAQKIIANKVPESMKGLRVLSLDVGALLAGAKFRGEFEERFKSVLQALIDLKGKAVLFIDEIHMLIGAGNGEGGADAANLLKPALARGEILCIGATTLSEYKKYFKKDQALDRRFQPIVVQEPTRLETIAILRNLKNRYEIHHGIKITDEAIVFAVDLSIRFLPNRKLPDKALDIMDESSSRVRLSLDSMPRELEQMRANLENMQMERQTVDHSAKNASRRVKLDVRIEKVEKDYQSLESVWLIFRQLLEELSSLEVELNEMNELNSDAKTQGDYQFAATISYEKIPLLSKQVANLKAELETMQQKHSFLSRVVDTTIVSSVVSEWSGVPIEKIEEKDKSPLKNLAEKIKQRIFGQDEAVQAISKAVKRSKLGISDNNKAMGVFMFLGPTGVGKTELAKALAGEVFGSESRLVRIDLSEFSEAHSVSRLIGSPPGYVGFEEGGELSEALRRWPYCTILFDEVEKAHPKIFDLLLQLLDEGKLTDSKGESVDCRNAMIILTSNLQVWDRQGVSGSLRDDSIRQSLASHFRMEFINRIDGVVVFKSLNSSALREIIRREMAKLNLRLEERQLRVEMGSNLESHLVEIGLSSEFGGRAIIRSFRETVLDTLSDRLLEESDQDLSGAYVADIDSQGDIYWSLEDLPQKYLPAPKSS